MLSDTKAIMGMPVYILVAIMVASVVIAVFSLSIYNIWQESQYQKVEYEVGKIVSEAENMFEYADEGSMVTVHVEFPSSMSFLVFGGVPEKGISEPASDTKLDKNASNGYYFVMNDGKISVSYSTARFSNDNTSRISIFHSGVYDIKLELVKIKGETFVKIY